MGMSRRETTYVLSVLAAVVENEKNLDLNDQSVSFDDVLVA
jgi:hypothetical protein